MATVADLRKMLEGKDDASEVNVVVNRFTYSIETGNVTVDGNYAIQIVDKAPEAINEPVVDDVQPEAPVNQESAESVSESVIEAKAE